jgi:hypothetical protein
MYWKLLVETRECFFVAVCWKELSSRILLTAGLVWLLSSSQGESGTMKSSFSPSVWGTLSYLNCF